jgi:hypothetical protein
MRLTKYDKEAFVKAVMNDVPSVDYDEQVRSKMKAWGLESLPEDLRPLAKKYPDYFEKPYVYTPANCPNVSTICRPDWVYYGFKDQEPEKYAELTAIDVEAKAQYETREAMRRKVTGLINVCSTLKTAKARLPEFEKYLPAEHGGTGVVNLPVANVLAELMNAGWPKGQEAAA